MMSGRYREWKWWGWVGIFFPLLFVLVPLVLSPVITLVKPMQVSGVVTGAFLAILCPLFAMGIWYCTVVPILEARYLHRRPPGLRQQSAKTIRCLPWIGLTAALLLGFILLGLLITILLTTGGEIPPEVWRWALLWMAVPSLAFFSAVVVQKVTRKYIEECETSGDLYCRECGYSLHAVAPEGRCAECGERVHPEDRRTLRHPSEPIKQVPPRRIIEVRNAWYLWAYLASMAITIVSVRFAIIALMETPQAPWPQLFWGSMAVVFVFALSSVFVFGLSGDRRVKIHCTGHRLMNWQIHMLWLPSALFGLAVAVMTGQQIYAALFAPEQWNLNFIRVPFTLCGLGLIGSALYLKKMRPFIEKRFRALIRERNLCFECGGALSDDDPETCPECGEPVHQ